MSGKDTSSQHARWGWLLAGATGLALGAGVGLAAPTGGAHPLWLCAPFALLLGSIAILPAAAPGVWHRHYASISLLLGGLVAGYFLTGRGGPGRVEIAHAAVEYYAFIALVGGLYVVSGGILVDVRDRGTPLRNTLLLGAGAVLANILGTTGASVLLIRPFLRMNRGRTRPAHVVFFIFIVSNCAGCLLPIGDPPLYIGFLRGVPFLWTLTHLWPMWLLVNGALLAMFFVFDSRVPPCPALHAGRPVRFDPQDRSPLVVAGASSIVCLLLLIAGVFIDPMIRRAGIGWLSALPVGSTFQIGVAALAYRLASPSIRRSNGFSFEPVLEVGFLFIGIFLAMAPALAYLRAHASSLGVDSATAYYYLTGSLSAVLDNAPTYAAFYEVARAGPAATFDRVLVAISLGAVFFGAMTYIGNGPNFMVKAIVDAAYRESNGDDETRLGARTPTFAGYLGWSVVVLLPVLVVNWLVFIR